MSYDNEFYRLYTKYLDESEVRRKHEMAFRMLNDSRSFCKVVDLGCGRANEFLYLASPKTYLGIDTKVDRDRKVPYPEPSLDWTGHLVNADYRTELGDILNFLNYKPTAFVSLFSTECIQDQDDAYDFYEFLFESQPSFEVGLVSGFYYANRYVENPIAEAGGIQSYQNNDPLHEHFTDVFEEVRLEMHVPSQLFGLDVFEVWKLLRRIKS